MIIIKRKIFISLFIIVNIFFILTIKAHALQLYTGSDILPKGYKNKTISMDFKGAKLNDVLKIFSQQSGLNFIAATTASNKTLNLYFDKVPVEEALDKILSANNLTYELKQGSNVFIVKERMDSGKNLMTRIYILKHATVPSSKLNSTFSKDNNSSKSDSDSSSVSGIISSIEKLLSDDGSIVEDPRTNSIIVSDLPSRFPAIEKAISRLDVRIPQILIEVEMLDISKSTSDLLGAKFGSQPISFNGGSKTSTFPFNLDNAVDDGFTFEDPRYTVSTLSFSGLTFAINFLKTQSDTKFLANPRILTLNNEVANIHIQTNEAIGIAATNTSSAEGNSSTVSQAERVMTGVFLTVTPQANLNTREIVMAVEPKVIQATTGATFQGQTFKDPEERGTKSMLRVNDGQTVIIGGLLKTDYSNTKTNVPILSKIPILGAAFRHKDKQEEQRELVIFITPSIIKENISKNFYSKKMFLREQDLPTPALAKDKKKAPHPKENKEGEGRLQLISEQLSHIEKQRF